jgi:uncharacterized protein YndB with AHSA1/START domain
VAGLTAHAETTITAPVGAVWRGLTDPELIKEYMFGSDVVTDWQPGSRIVWQGEYEGKPYEDHGTVLEVEPERRLVVTHFSPLTGQDDVPENYHRITYLLEPDGEATRVTLSQDGNGSDDEVEHSRSMWQGMLDGLKGVVEGRGAGS